MTILAIVVTYYPDKLSLYNNIEKFSKFVDKIIIWENTPFVDKLQYRLEDNPQIEYVGDGVNSISRALNFGWHYACQHHYDYLLTMDQDSEWQDFESYKKLIISGSLPFGIYGPPVNRSIDSIYEETHSLITSGMLVDVDILDKISGYDERFKIDGVDMDFCFRARTFNIFSYIVNGGMLYQKFGNPQNVKVGSFHFSFSSYSSSRRYNTAKAKAMLLRKYKFRFTSIIKLLYVELFLKPFYILIGEHNKKEKLWSSYKGFISGLTTKDLGYINKNILVL